MGGNVNDAAGWDVFFGIMLRGSARKLAREQGADVVRVMDGDRVLGYVDLLQEK